MNAYLHRSEDRGHVKAGWLESYHSFSFGSWYNPKYMGVSALRVINDDRIDAHNGFGTHSHDNMEILTCVLDGAISHRDTMGNEGQIKAGEWQLMSAVQVLLIVRSIIPIRQCIYYKSGLFPM